MIFREQGGTFETLAARMHVDG